MVVLQNYRLDTNMLFKLLLKKLHFSFKFMIGEFKVCNLIISFLLFCLNEICHCDIWQEKKELRLFDWTSIDIVKDKFERKYNIIKN